MTVSHHISHFYTLLFFFFNDTATTEIYTLSLHDALPISSSKVFARASTARRCSATAPSSASWSGPPSRSTPKRRSEEHTSELQSRSDLVCRLLLEKKKTENIRIFDGSYQ